MKLRNLGKIVKYIAPFALAAGMAYANGNGSNVDNNQSNADSLAKSKLESKVDITEGYQINIEGPKIQNNISFPAITIPITVPISYQENKSNDTMASDTNYNETAVPVVPVDTTHKAKPVVLYTGMIEEGDSMPAYIPTDEEILKDIPNLGQEGSLEITETPDSTAKDDSAKTYSGARHFKRITQGPCHFSGYLGHSNEWSDPNVASFGLEAEKIFYESPNYDFSVKANVDVKNHNFSGNNNKTDVKFKPTVMFQHENAGVGLSTETSIESEVIGDAYVGLVGNAAVGEQDLIIVAGGELKSSKNLDIKYETNAGLHYQPNNSTRFLITGGARSEGGAHADAKVTLEKKNIQYSILLGGNTSVDIDDLNNSGSTTLDDLMLKSNGYAGVEVGTQRFGFWIAAGAGSTGNGYNTPNSLTFNGIAGGVRVNGPFKYSVK